MHIIYSEDFKYKTFLLSFMQAYNYKFPNIYFEEWKGRKTFYTKNLFPGNQVYGEELVRVGNNEYRAWDHKRSKLAAAIQKGVSQIGIREGEIVLYLGASSGTTPSHISDIVGEKGFVFALDFASRMVKDLVFLAEKRKNIAPILANANKPLTYAHLVTQADVVYMDIAQKNQTEIFLKNCEMFLKPGGFGLYFVKARSIDVTKKPKDLFKKVREELEKVITIVDYKELDTYEKDHCLFICKKR
jgi:fibrillarin-like pre-rRNA processing protein